MSTTLKVGSLAPEFKGQAYVNGDFKDVSLKDYLGKKWVVLYFYPLDFTFVCPTEIKAFAEAEGKFKELGAEVIGCSTDSAHSHKAWFQRDIPNAKHPVLADTAHQISRDYGVLLEDKGIALRGTFIIDPKGVLQWMTVNALGVGRSVDETLRTLEAIQYHASHNGEVCPAEWKPGKPAIKV